MFQPFASVPYLPSLALWTIASAALYLASCFAVWRRLERLRPYRTEVAILAIGSPALWQLILHGQNSAVAVASLTGGWLCLRARRHVLAGLALGLLFYKPQRALAAVVALALNGRWVVVASMTAGTLIQLAVVHLTLGPGAILEYVSMLRRLPEVVSLIEPKLHLMHSFRAFFSLLPLMSSYALPLSLACSLAALAVVIWHWRSRVDEDMSFALLLMATILVSPHTSVYDLVLLGPALLIVADRTLAAPAVDRTSWVLVASAFLLPLASHYSSIVRVQPMVLCIAWLLVRCGWTGRTSTEGSQIATPRWQPSTLAP